MGQYLDFFPKIPYDVNNSFYFKNYSIATNILLRFGFVKDLLDKGGTYYDYVITDDERPDTLADKIYGDPQAHWAILVANNMLNPNYDWPLNDNNFNNYIIGKYGSIANAKTTIHHYEKVVSRTEETTGINSIFRYVVDYDIKTQTNITLSDVSGVYSAGEAVYQGSNLAYSSFSANVISWNTEDSRITLANAVGKIAKYSKLEGDSSTANGVVIIFNTPEAPYDYYLSLPDEQAVTTYSNVAGRTVTETISRDAVTIYDYELYLNETKREIILIKPQYYAQLRDEFLKIVGADRGLLPFIRSFR
jgi:hypothetical protein